MKFRQNITLSFLLTFVLGSVAFAQVVEIPDPNLRQAVREALNLPDGAPTTQAVMLRLIRLNADNRGVADLTGLEFATELRRLEIHDSFITNLTPIAGLVKLEYISMWGTSISDLSPLANLTALRELYAPGCQIVDISPLVNLKQLVILNLRGNGIVDVSPLANLTSLRYLEINRNNITDHSPLDGLSLVEFIYDQSCEMPPLPLEPRLTSRTYPSAFGAQWLFGHDPRIDLMYGGSYFGMGWRNGHLVGDLEYAIRKRDELLATNPNMVFLVEIRWASDGISAFGEDWPYWLRDADGNIFVDNNQVSDDPRVFIDFMHPGAQEIIVQMAVEVSKCGLFDGIVLDSWGEHVPLLPRELYSLDDGKLAEINEVQQQAKVGIVRRIRAATRPNFLIQVNSHRNRIPLTGPFINGLSMESGIPDWFFHDAERLHQALLEAESTLLWAEQNLREPHINGVAGQGVFAQPADSPYNRRWVRVVTALSLTHADGYTIYQKEWGDWYDFLETDLGYPIGGTAQLYEGRPGLFMREFTNGWAVYNRSGETQEIALPERATGVASGVEDTTHVLPNYDGEMYLRAKPKNPADVNEDGVVNILDLTLVAQGFGTGSLEADVNGDGVVNVFDLVFVANQF